MGVLWVLLVTHGWSRLSHMAVQWPTDVTIEYAILDGFCQSVEQGTLEDFALHRFSCADAQQQVRDVLDEWGYAGDLRFAQVADGQGAALTFDGGPLQRPAIAQAVITTQSAAIVNVEVMLSDSVCWYVDASFCARVRRLLGVVHGVVRGMLLACAMTTGLWLVARPPPRRARRFALALIAASSLAIDWSVLRPCYNCEPLRSVVAHEVGHAIGLGHPDVQDAWCGCGPAATPCAYAGDALMQSRSVHRVEECLTRDDVDGARSLYARGQCDRPVPCYASGTYITLARVLLAGAGALLFAAAATRCLRRRTRTAGPMD